MIGCLIGSTWEFTFHFLGDEFAYAVKQWPLGLSGWPKKLSHSIWDGGLFMFGVWLCFKYLPLYSCLHAVAGANWELWKPGVYLGTTGRILIQWPGLGLQ